jgi:hypothetical protein
VVRVTNPYGDILRFLDLLGFKAAVLLICIYAVRGSNLDLNDGYPDSVLITILNLCNRKVIRLPMWEVFHASCITLSGILAYF